MGRKSLPARGICLIVLLLAWFQSQAADLRPPAVPLVTHDPYFSIWSPADKLTDADTIHWTGKPDRLTSLMRIDGKEFRIMGREPDSVPPLPQTQLAVTPSRSTYTFEGGGVRLLLTFMSPALPYDLMICRNVPSRCANRHPSSVPGSGALPDARTALNP